MPINQESFNKNLFDLLKTKGFTPSPIDSRGEKMPVPNEAAVFKIEVNDEDVWITIDDAQQLKVYYNDAVMKDRMEMEDIDFTKFLKHLKDWSKRRQLGFELVNRDHLASDMAQREYMKNKQKLGEGYYPMGKKASYSDTVPQVKIILQHTRQIEEGEQRFRNIARIFVENFNGERFLLPTNRPGLARVYARHIAEGGTPYDERGKHITSLVEDYTKMAGFVRATRNGQFNESAQQLVNEGINHYQNLRETLSRMTGHRGYNNYFESYTPVLNEESEDETNLNELFVQETLDPRIESVLPILKRLNKNITEMSVVKELEEWAESITEVEDETTKTLAEPADEMLDESEERPYVCVHAKKGKHECKASSSYEAAKKAAQHWGLKSTAGIDAYLADVKHTPVNEAPGAETLKHNQNTEKSNLNAFDLAEGFSDSRDVADQIIDSIGGEEGLSLDDVYRAISEYQTMMDNPHKLDVDEVAEIVLDRLNIQEVDEGLDANQKRVGQLGPTEKVGPKGAVGKLVGASESVEMDRLKTLSGIK
jgi:hypothetical protein